MVKAIMFGCHYKIRRRMLEVCYACESLAKLGVRLFMHALFLVFVKPSVGVKVQINDDLRSSGREKNCLEQTLID